MKEDKKSALNQDIEGDNNIQNGRDLLKIGHTTKGDNSPITGNISVIVNELPCEILLLLLKIIQQLLDERKR